MLTYQFDDQVKAPLFIEPFVTDMTRLVTGKLSHVAR
jgi:hypothetical protein